MEGAADRRAGDSGRPERPSDVRRVGVFPQEPCDAYALLDSGDGEKLERFGQRTLVRPDPQALWRRRDPGAWGRAELVFVRESDRGGRWEERGGAAAGSRAGARRAGAAGPAVRTQRGRGGGAGRRGRGPSEEQEDPALHEWPVELRGARFVLRATPFKHVGLFPEQAVNWSLVERAAPLLGREPRLLNLFGYSGVASVLALRAGYAVTHVDASRLALAWTRDNLAASGLPADAARLVLDDALAFARREARRGRRYDAVLVDPPSYGRGPKGETWRFEEHIAGLLEAVGALLAERALLVLSTYAIGIAPLTLENLLDPLCAGEALLEVGELALREEPSASAAPARLLPCGFCARLRRGLPEA